MEKYLLSYRLKIPAFILIAAGATIAVFYFLNNIRIEFPVFALFSSYIEVKTFAIFRTNIADELILLFILAGLFLLVFTRDKNEKVTYEAFRIKALVMAFITNIVLSAMVIAFVFGSGFISMLVLNIFSTLIFYLGYFNFYKYRG